MAKVSVIGGQEFEVVKEGLNEAEVVAFINDLVSEIQALRERLEHYESLWKLAQTTVIEAEKQAAAIKAETQQEAEAESARIKAQAQQEAELLVSGTRKKLAQDLKSEMEQIYQKAVSSFSDLLGVAGAEEALPPEKTEPESGNPG